MVRIRCLVETGNVRIRHREEKVRLFILLKLQEELMLTPVLLNQSLIHHKIVTDSGK